MTVTDEEYAQLPKGAEAASASHRLRPGTPARRRAGQRLRCPCLRWLYAQRQMLALIHGGNMPSIADAYQTWVPQPPVRKRRWWRS